MIGPMALICLTMFELRSQPREMSLIPSKPSKLILNFIFPIGASNRVRYQAFLLSIQQDLHRVYQEDQSKGKGKRRQEAEGRQEEGEAGREGQGSVREGEGCEEQQTDKLEGRLAADHLTAVRER